MALSYQESLRINRLIEVGLDPDKHPGSKSIIAIKLNFGKYRGYTIKEVIKMNNKYLHWLVKQDWNPIKELNWLIGPDPVEEYYKNK